MNRRMHEITRRDAIAAIAAPLAVLALPRFVHAQDGATPPPQVDVDATPFPSFMEDGAVAGTVRCVGSSSVGLLLNALRPGFRESQDKIEIEVISSGSANGPKALASREALLAPMSRPMKPDEIKAVESARKGTVDFIDLAIDAIGICVHAKNPMTRATLKDLDRIFGRERRRGGAAAVKWSDVGVTGSSISDRTIALFGMGPGTGSNGLVQDVVLQGGAFRTSVNEEPVSSSVVQAIATDPQSIGYCSVLFDSSRVRKLEIETLDGSGFVAPTDELIRSGRYPLARALRVYFVREELAKSPAARKFLQFTLSQDGQDIIEELGQKTLAPKDAHAMFAKVK
jgi:phosphate transport system substrate-binding protein